MAQVKHFEFHETFTDRVNLVLVDDFELGYKLEEVLRYPDPSGRKVLKEEVVEDDELKSIESFAFCLHSYENRSCDWNCIDFLNPRKYSCDGLTRVLRFKFNVGTYFAFQPDLVYDPKFITYVNHMKGCRFIILCRSDVVKRWYSIDAVYRAKCDGVRYWLEKEEV